MGGGTNGRLSAEALLELTSSRRDVIEALAEGVRTGGELAEKLDVSRSTISRTINELERAGIATRGADGYRITARGRLALEAVDRVLERLESLVAAEEFLQYVPPDAPLDPVMFRDAEFVFADPGQAYRPGEEMGTLMDRAESLVGVSPAYSHPGVVEKVRRHVLETDVDYTFLVSEAMFEHLRRLDGLEEPFAAPNLTMFVIDRPPYGVFVVDTGERTVAAYLAYDEDSALKALARTTASESIDWARRRIEEFGSDARRVV